MLYPIYKSGQTNSRAHRAHVVDVEGISQHGLSVPPVLEPQEMMWHGNGNRMEYVMQTKILFYQHVDIYIYIYLENHKDNFFCPYGFGHFFCPFRVFSKYGHVRLQTLYRLI